jgi:hypothetical protein
VQEEVFWKGTLTEPLRRVERLVGRSMVYCRCLPGWLSWNGTPLMSGSVNSGKGVN